MKVFFLILHYNEIELTKKAVDSIMEMDNSDGNDREIVIVDNCSLNGTGKELVKLYEGDNKIPVHVILNSENGGFSKGNNIGYSFIKVNHDADFIVALNNDITFPQKDFVKILTDIYGREESKFYLAGPDVYTPHIRSHISPLFDRPRGIAETDDKLAEIDAVIKGFEEGFSLSKYFRYIQEKYQDNVFLKLYNRLRSKQYSGATPFDKPFYNCVLNGACLIVDKRYIEENDVLFEEKTFLYAEEDFITLRLARKNQMIRYCPELLTDHVGQGSSGFGRMNYKTYCKKNADTSRKIKEAFEIYRKNL